MGFDTAFLGEIGIVAFVTEFDLLSSRQVNVLHPPAASGRAGGDGAEQPEQLQREKNINSIDCCLIYSFVRCSSLFCLWEKL